MLRTLGRAVYRFRWWIIVISLLSLVPAAWMTSRGGHLQSVIIPSHTQSGKALELIEKQLPSSALPSFGLIFRSKTLLAADPAFQLEVRRALAPLRNDPHVASVTTAYEGSGLNPRYVSRDGRAVMARVEIKGSGENQNTLATEIYPKLRAKIHSNGLQINAFGQYPRNYDLTRLAERDASRGEIRVLPLVGLVLVLVFGSVVGAVVPLAIGVLAVTAGMAGVLVLAHFIPVLVYAKNVIVMVGLGVAIDYSLFISSRFRAELELHPVPEALANTMATTGRAILFSGATVAIGFLGLLWLPVGHVSSIGLAGTIVVTSAVIYALTFLPAVLAVLGPKINGWRLDFTRGTDPAQPTRFWRVVASAVMAHPWRVVVPAALFLIVLGIPFGNIRLGATDVSGLPRSAESRRGWDQLHSEFKDADSNPVIIVVKYSGTRPLSPEHLKGIYGLSRWLARMDGVNSVDSIVDLDPSINLDGYLQLYSDPASGLPQGVQLVMKKMVGKDIVMLVAQTSLHAGGQKALDLVRKIYRSHPPAGGEVMVTGETAFHLDFIRAVRDRSPSVIGFMVIVTYLVLFVMLRSFLLPLKAVIMNILSISASFGALVWIFQYGHLAFWLHFTPGPIEAMNPIMMFCIVFGLSMDYEVLLLSRIGEEYRKTCDNTRAVALGLEHTGRMITGAAAIMALVLFAFAFADLTVIKEIGVAMGLAIVIDATIVRCLLVPATMRLLGRWNWWAPHPIGEIYEFCSSLRGRRHRVT
ncbi:MAG: MMPL family transporter [Syntrophobacteraceae bacterium]|nr:MMPL family transporter [Syntrophobacteraceae bacterium]